MADDQTSTTATSNPEIEKLRAEMVAMVKQFSDQNQQLQEQNAQLLAQVKMAQLSAQGAVGTSIHLVGPKLPTGLKIGQVVSYINHTARPEYAEILEISESQNFVNLQVFGKHENDVRTVTEVKFGDKVTKNSFTLDSPPPKPTPSLPRHHPKGLQVPAGA